MYIDMNLINDYLKEVAATNYNYDATLGGDGYYQPVSYDQIVSRKNNQQQKRKIKIIKRYN